MKLYEATQSTLLDPVAGRVIERGDAVVGLIECRGGTLELDRKDLVAIGTAVRDLVQRIDAAYDRRARGQRPIPAHGQPARPYIPPMAGPATAVMPTAPAAAPVPGRAAIPRHAAPQTPQTPPAPTRPADAGRGGRGAGPGGAGPSPGGGALMAVRRQPRTARPGRLRVPLRVWWHQLRRRWTAAHREPHLSYPNTWT
ncbi:hypothetical protein ACBJ59_61150 [Nonomuraea sp. MTCD27]|uniref:hypothetical protein n=1 Tax=Nonomuraea sp. MTCD27 TaxID=1676747 RepID=UPI0035BF8463